MYVKDSVAAKTYDDYKRYSKYIAKLQNPLEFAREISKLSEDIQGKVMRVASKFAQYLDTKYNADIFHEYVLKIRKRLHISWGRREPSGPRYVPSINDILTAIRIAKSMNVHIALKIYGLAVSGIRPCELSLITWNSINWDIGLAKINKASKTKRANYMFLSPKLIKILKQFKGKKLKPFGYSEATEFYVLREIRKKVWGFDFYGLRHFNSSYLALKGMTDLKIDVIQGRAPISVLRRYYIHIKDVMHMLAELKREYDELIKDLDSMLHDAFTS